MLLYAHKHSLCRRFAGNNCIHKLRYYLSFGMRKRKNIKWNQPLLYSSLGVISLNVVRTLCNYRVIFINIILKMYCVLIRSINCISISCIVIIVIGSIIQIICSINGIGIVLISLSGKDWVLFLYSMRTLVYRYLYKSFRIQ